MAGRVVAQRGERGLAGAPALEREREPRDGVLLVALPPWRRLSSSASSASRAPSASRPANGARADCSTSRHQRK